MQVTPALQKIVTQLAEKHAVNLDQAGAYLRLALPGYGQLVIENIGANRISITNYLKVHTDWVSDPEIVIYVDYRPSATEPGKVQHVWTPIEVTDLFGGWRLYAEPDSAGDLVLYDPVGQMELADLADHVVAKHLAADGWLEHATCANPSVSALPREEMLARDIRDDDVPF